jgi:presenilin-like A22 family membrane protease
MYFVGKGNPQAGLPLLNSGAIIGYVVSYVLVFNELSLGINLPW